MVGDGRELLVDNVLVDIQKYNGNPIGIEFPAHVELTVTSTEPGVRGDTASGGVTKLATLETGLENPGAALHQGGREGPKCTPETREFAGTSLEDQIPSSKLQIPTHSQLPTSKALGGWF
jgi:elongation factor P